MKSLLNTIALTALIVTSASLPMVSANAVETVTPVQTVTVSGSAGINL